MDKTAIECNGLDQFQTQQAIMRGRWHMLSEQNKRDEIWILVREAHKCRYE